MKEKFINWLIKITKADTNKISDGYHTFEDLYEHRIELFIALVNIGNSWHNLEGFNFDAWKSKMHSDGSEWKGWFIAGINTKKGRQITYHLPIKYWKRLDISTLRKAPDFDGHTPKDVLERLKTL